MNKTTTANPKLHNNPPVFAPIGYQLINIPYNQKITHRYNIFR